MSTIAERVARGMALLDREQPGWWRTGIPAPINLDTLDIDAPCRCILGQLFTDAVERPVDAYEAGLDALGLGEALTNDCDYGYGFDGDDSEMASLTAEWKKAITQRRGNHPLT